MTYEEPHATGGSCSLHALAPATKHRFRDVDSRDGSFGTPGKRERDTRGPGGDVENGPRCAPPDVGDHLAPPAAVLSEGQQLFEEVVVTREPPEQVLGEPVGIDGRCLHGTSLEI